MLELDGFHWKPVFLQLRGIARSFTIYHFPFRSFACYLHIKDTVTSCEGTVEADATILFFWLPFIYCTRYRQCFIKLRQPWNDDQNESEHSLTNHDRTGTIVICCNNWNRYAMAPLTSPDLPIDRLWSRNTDRSGEHVKSKVLDHELDSLDDVNMELDVENHTLISNIRAFPRYTIGMEMRDVPKAKYRLLAYLGSGHCLRMKDLSIKHRTCSEIPVIPRDVHFPCTDWVICGQRPYSLWHFDVTASTFGNQSFQNTFCFHWT